ncbi:amidohydrolase [Streptomyces anulatus]|uniref:amidohydrolase n=1 Tax=Streptomyces TaxID=1883 RepID=UPI00067D4F7C|nr:MULTISPECIES: amidohydrolase [Streptomyces]KND30420.1 N-acyl-L-amino acid amidohydrolase [Streptomyces europaeiscabiei]KPL32118.1 N-acyl-L-amino acid amidohydrolase [Streptomyces anulatus]KQX36319.1 N-acyl-L-amino acid amidohydrolase [Streptomyces sp. Root1295]KRA36872.1 N-acyl-L-amino acid amidohydrolase [Streptomyces sp. Root63]MBT1100906.1 amidohydrolase [Streptomyces sp. Tu10]
MKSRASRPHHPAGQPGGGALPGRLSDELRAELIAFRRDMHMHPELGNQEFRTTAAIKDRLEKAGLKPKVLAVGTGVMCDVGEWDGVTPMLALRADIDALPIPDTKAGVPYRSTVPDRAHACGHDVHTTTVLGAGLVLAGLDREGLLPNAVRLIFQPAEEVLPGGAVDAIESGVLEGVGRIIGVHCDPKVDVGRIGLRIGAITSACDRLEVTLDGPGGHTARPHLTTDLVTAAARIAVDVPALLARRVDARSGLAVTWGRLETGHAPNVIPQHAELSGTVRCLDLDAWRAAPDLVHAAIDEVAGMHRAKTVVNYVRGVPPVVNDAESIGLLDAAMTERRGSYAIEDTEQSLGGEDFSWYLERVPGAMARLGVRTPGDTRGLDLHRGNFDVDEEAITVGVELFTAAALFDGNR